jgi:hypothetical protein
MLTAARLLNRSCTGIICDIARKQQFNTILKNVRNQCRDFLVDSNSNYLLIYLMNGRLSLIMCHRSFHLYLCNKFLIILCDRIVRQVYIRHFNSAVLISKPARGFLFRNGFDSEFLHEFVTFIVYFRIL